MEFFRCPWCAGDSVRRVVLLGLTLLAVPWTAVAADREAEISGALSGLTNRELERRLEFLETRFRAQQSYARSWQTGFTAAWATGAALGTVQASLSSEPDNRVPAIVTAAKAAIGTTKLLVSPHPARLGAAPLEIQRETRRATLEARLLAGERQLLAIEHKARERRSWVAHAANVGLNALGGGIIVALGNPSDAIQNVGVGILFGEVMLWSMPKRGIQDLQDYRALVSTGVRRPVEPVTSVVIVPMSRGAAVEIRF